MEQGPSDADAAYAVIESGWMQDTVFENWLKDVFCNYIQTKYRKTSGFTARWT